METDPSEYGERRRQHLRIEFLRLIAERLEESQARRINHALDVAEVAHAEQVRDDGTPYILHPLRIALFLLQELAIDDPDILSAALLHDVLEDHKAFTSEYLASDFGDNVSSIVRTLTKPVDKTRQEVNRVYFERLRNADEASKLIKLADKLDNLWDAQNCPDANKRSRTWAEAEQFYLPLCLGLSSLPLRGKLGVLLQQAITSLKRLDEKT